MLKLALRLLRKYKPRKHGWFNTSLTWQEAEKQCSGYNADAILQKIKTSTLKVKNGEVAFERDGIVYDKVYYSWPLLSQLLLSASINKGDLSIIDFGGSLGTTFFQNKHYLKQLNNVQWSVVEQQNFVNTGKEVIEGEGLNFFYKIEDAFKSKGQHQVLLLSCVLPYIENPYDLINYFISFNFEFIIIESTYFNNKADDEICIQKVDPLAYEASYPCWMLDYEKIKSAFLGNYEVFNEYFNNIHFYLNGEKIEYKSVVFKRKK